MALFCPRLRLAREEAATVKGGIGLQGSVPSRRVRVRMSIGRVASIG